MMKLNNHPIFPYIQLIRLPNTFTAISNIGAAHFIATLGAVQWGALLLLCLASMCFYSAGMVLNDCFDYEEDAKDRPSRPLPAGKVPVKAAWALGIALLIVGLAFTALVGLRSFGIAVCLSLLIVGYDSLFKEGYRGATMMGLCRYFNWLLGLSVMPFTGGNLAIALIILLYVFALTTLSKEETNPTRRAPFWVCTICLAGVGLLALGLYWGEVLPNAWGLGLVAVGALILGKRLWDTYQDFSAPQIQKTIITLVLGIIPLDAAIVFLHGHFVAAICILALLIPSRWLAKSISVT